MNRILQLPAELCPSDAIYLAALIQRTQQTDASAQLHLAKNFSFNGSPPDSYLLLASMSRFAWCGSLTADFLASAPTTAVGNTLPQLPPEVPTSSPFPLVAGCQLQLTGPDQILDEATDFDALAGALLVFVDDEIMSVSETDMTDTGAYALTVIRGMFGTTIADHFDGSVIFIVRRTDLFPVTHPSFVSGNSPQMKLAVGAVNVVDVEPFTFTVGDSNQPTITSVSPNNWAAGVNNAGPDLVITGTNFTTGADMSITGPLEDAIFSGWTVVSDTEITVTGVQSMPAGTWTVNVFTAYGMATLANAIIVT